MLGLFGLIMEVMQVLRSGRGTQMLVLMERQHLVDMCVLRRAQDKRDHATKNPRAETRTCCPVRMGLTLDRVAGNYEVFDLLLAHNHVLHLPKPFI